MTGHAGSVNTCVVSADGRRALSGSHDKTLRLWDLASGAELIRLSGHSAPVTACPDHRRWTPCHLGLAGLHAAHLGPDVRHVHRDDHGSSAYLCLAAGADWLLAGDQAGNVWILRDQMTSTPAARRA